MLGHVSTRTATMAEVLRDQGYATFAVGKWHLAPMEECSAAGPFDQWPLGRGFDRFYGFLDGETDQFHPELVCDNHPIEPPGGPDDGYHLSEDLVDQALKMISDTQGRATRPAVLHATSRSAPPTPRTRRRPSTWPSTAAASTRAGTSSASAGSRTPARARHHPRRHRARAAQPGRRRRGTTCPTTSAVSPPACRRRSPRSSTTPTCRSAASSTACARWASSTTRSSWCIADNGASQEGGPFGVMHEMKFFNGIFETPDEAIARIDDIGGPHSHTNYPWGWAQCGNTPFKWYKQNTHEGGVHVPMIVHWPPASPPTHRRHRATSSCSSADIAPTIYDLLGVTAARRATGASPQQPVTGHSFAAALRDPSAPATNTLQYFENGGSRALVAGEWKAVCRHEKGADFDTEPWELYHIAEDRVGVQRPRRGDARQARRARSTLWWQEAERARRAAARRPRRRAVRRALPRPVAAPREPPLRVPPADVADARPGVGRARRPQLRPDRPRHPRRRATRACCTPPAPRTPGFSVFVQDGRLVLRLQRVRRPHRRRVRRSRCRRASSSCT